MLEEERSTGAVVRFLRRVGLAKPSDLAILLGPSRRSPGEGNEDEFRVVFLFEVMTVQRSAIALANQHQWPEPDVVES